MSFRDTFYYIAGIGFLGLAKLKHMLQGYSSPKPFDVSETERCVDYDISVVDGWLGHLQEYTDGHGPIEGKSVLELGPGSDLGIGLYLLFLGCERYSACDVNDLVKTTPDSFYDHIFSRLENMKGWKDVDFLREQLRSAPGGKPAKLNYLVREDFDLAAAFGEATIDLVFSQAAFEHFDDIDATILQLSTVCKPGAVLVAEIDLKTHSRWIRDRDPNNIYRYSNGVFRLFGFRGIPRRLRPFQYKEALERHGWTDISIAPLTILEDHDKSYSGMHGAFADPENQMDYLSIMLCARKE